MSEPIDEKAVVLAKYPGAHAVRLDGDLTYHRWVIHVEGVIRMILGGGPTEADAWHDVRVQIDAEERGKARLEGGDDR